MCSHQWKHDVFVSFRGQDLRKNFISHLFRELNQAGINYFSDEAREDAGKEIDEKLLRAIYHARFALVVFSANYADSKWCLNELVEILKCRRQLKNRGHAVIPIFHGVDTAEVSKLTSDGKFGQAFERLREKTKDDKQIKIWKDALAEAKHISGFHLQNDANGNESTLIKIIVEQLAERIRQIRPPYFVKDATGVDHLANDVISLLNNGHEKDVRMIGICGTAGMGKTTVAGVAFDRIRGKFECSVFLPKIGEANWSDIPDLQKKLLQNLMKKTRQECYDVIDTKTNKIKGSMRHKKILLVVDGVTEKKQLDDFGAGEREWFCPGSRILITTRDQNLLKVLKVDEKYIVKGLSPNEALQLFCHHAFKKSEPTQGYEELSESLIHYAGGHPLALRKLGSYLRDESKDQWHKTLDKLVRSPYLDCIVGVGSSLGLPIQSVGPYGGQRGDAYDDGRYTGVRQISVRVESVINSITIDYDQHGCMVRSFEHGRCPYGKKFTVKLDYPNEYLTSISGHISDYRNSMVIHSLKFHSNRKTYGPVGSENGQFFRSPQVDGGKIIGFHGNCGGHLDSIGAHFGPILHAYPFEVVGPFGGDYGTDIWDDGRHTDVREIVVGFDSAITYISVLYDKWGHPVGPFTHGTSGGSKTYRIKLDYPYEYLSSASGHTEKDSGVVILRSLTFHSNVKSYGPFGTAEGRRFSFPYTGGKIIGFHGNCDGPRLESIGAFYEPIPHTHPFKLFGPFGGDGGDPWDDGRYIDIKRIVVRYSDFIYSIDFDYVNMDGSIRSTTHGQNLGGHIYEVELGYPDEFVTSFSGFFTGIINSLTFRTNKRIWGPIGREKGEYISLPSEVGKVVGFFGTSGDFLESIGAQVELYSNKLYPFKSVGLFGSSNASFWDDSNKHTNVRKIIVEFEPSKGPLIQSIAFQYEEENRELWQSETHGGIHGNKFHIVRDIKIHTIRIDDPDEYLTSISGYIMGGITSLTFQTNKKTIGPIGGELGRHFSCPATGGQIVGFYGWSGEHLEAIGAHFEPISHLHPIKSIGPFGGLGGCAWDDGKFNGVREIKVMHDNVIHYIMFVYDKSGERVCSVMHGDHSGEYMANITKVKLDYPREYLTSISGYKRANGDDYINNAIVQSLTFHTNKGRHGPFGKETGKYFWYPSTGTRIIGFYGRCRETLNSIGVYAEPIPHLYPFQTIGPFGGSGGTEWDDGLHTDVRAFDITVGDVIQSVGITYDNNGSPVVRPPHGGTKEPSFIRLLLDYPKERLVSISGYTNGYGNNPDNIIHSLKIHTTKTTYGPFGSKDARGRLTEFHIPSASGGGRIVGFFGRAGSRLNSIGARLEPY